MVKPVVIRRTNPCKIIFSSRLPSRYRVRFIPPIPENSSLLVPSRLLLRSLLCSASAATCSDGSLAPLQEADAPRERGREMGREYESVRHEIERDRESFR
jgi:hypothetical protein